ncbi:MAG: hypothetical protein ACREB9_05060 [Thermoplasmata archaeon]
MPETVSIIIPTRAMRYAYRLPPGADEVILQGGEGGCAHAKNLGARRARGSILLFVDDDQELWGDLRFLRHPPRQEAAWHVRHHYETTRDAYTAHAFRMLNVMLWTGSALGVGPCMAIRRRLFETLGGFRYDIIWEDKDLAQRVLELGPPMGTMPLVEVTHRPLTRWRDVAAIWGRKQTAPPPGYAPFRRWVPTATAAGTWGTTRAPR